MKFGSLCARASAMTEVCQHIAGSNIDMKPKTLGCGECMKTGDTWVHLRVCLSCGEVSCCDSSKNRHATQHYHNTSHPVMRSMEPGERWMWCYFDEMMVDLDNGDALQRIA
jgi:uncharacterized UBP type Zn finger protein